MVLTWATRRKCMSGHHHKLCSLTIHQFICDFLNLLLFKFLIFLPACQQASQAGRWTGRQASFYIGLHCVYFSRHFLRDMSPFYFILFLFYGLLILFIFCRPHSLQDFTAFTLHAAFFATCPLYNSHAFKKWKIGGFNIPK